jgi:hypothetical protein
VVGQWAFLTAATYGSHRKKNVRTDELSEPVHTKNPETLMAQDPRVALLLGLQVDAYIEVMGGKPGQAHG